MAHVDQELAPSSGGSAFALPEICHAVLNPRSFTFVAENAPWSIVNSFERQRQRLAMASLRVVCSTLLRQLGIARSEASSSSVAQCSQSSVSTLKSVLLFVACLLAQLGLGALSMVRHGIPRWLHLWASANILSNIGDLLINRRFRERKEIDGSCGIEDCGLDKARLSPVDHNAVTADILRALTISLPTNLSRLIFLATLRDNNSGRYYHPELAGRFPDSLADLAMLDCHQRIYRRVVALPLEDLTDELDRYIATVPAPRERLIESWKKLKAYRVTIPMDADPVSREIFYMKVEVAVAILETRLPNQNFVMSGGNPLSTARNLCVGWTGNG